MTTLDDDAYRLTTQAEREHGLGATRALAERLVAWEPIVRAAVEWLNDNDDSSDPPLADAIMSCPKERLP